MTTLTANPSSNYSEEMIATITEAYTTNPTRATVDQLAKDTGKPVRSLISKLSALGIYVKATPVAKTSEPIVKKEVFVAELQAKLGIELPSFDKMTKADIQRLLTHLA